MVHHGHKTEEQEHVLIKTLSDKNFRGAQKVKILCLSSIMLVAFGTQALAQVYSTNTGANAQTIAQLEIRLQQMETQIRELTGRVEEQNYTINSLKTQIETMKQAEASSIALSTGDSQIAIPAREAPKPAFTFEPPQPTGIQTAKPAARSAQDATAQYEMAYAMVKQGNYGAAEEGLESFLQDNGDHVLAANAKYWLGETFYVRGQYKTAAKHFAEGFQKYPDNAKSPDMLLKLGMSLAGMDKNSDACVALSQLPVKFPSGSQEILGRGRQEMEKLGCES